MPESDRVGLFDAILSPTERHDALDPTVDAAHVYRIDGSGEAVPRGPLVA